MIARISVVLVFLMGFYSFKTEKREQVKKQKNNFFNLTVEAKGIRNEKGYLEFALYNDPEVYAEVGKTYKQIRKKITGENLSCTFENVPEGPYAMCIYHDENGNNKCDQNFFGIPTEGYGFSNDIKPVLSVPTFEECSIILDKPLSVSIDLIY
ncbi:MAG: DUF2141 domain-containing protein [Flavobacteriales bacterium]